MPGVNLSPEVLLLVAEHLANDADQAALSALSLANLQFAQICKVARYRYWDVSAASELRLQQYLSNPAWLQNVRHLRLPVVDPHNRIHSDECAEAPCNSHNVGLDEVMRARAKVVNYDLTLAAVVASVKHIQILDIVLGCPGFDQDSPATLQRTVIACASLKAVEHIHMSSLLTIKTRRIALDILQTPRKLKSLSFSWAEWYWLHKDEEVEQRRESEAKQVSTELRALVYSKEQSLALALCDDLFYV